MVPPAEATKVLACEQHLKWAEEVVDKGVTLVKDTKNYLPITPEKYKRIALFILDDGGTYGKSDGKLEETIRKELEKMELIFESMRLAPSAGNAQKWKFYAVKDPAVKEKIIASCLRAPEMLRQAPVILISAGNGAGIMTCGHDASSIDLSIPMSFAMLEAHALGLGTCWMASYHEDGVREALGLDETWRIAAISPLGYPDEDPDVRPRKPLEEVTEII